MPLLEEVGGPQRKHVGIERHILDRYPLSVFTDSSLLPDLDFLLVLLQFLNSFLPVFVSDKHLSYFVCDYELIVADEAPFLHDLAVSGVDLGFSCLGSYCQDPIAKVVEGF